MKEKKRNLKIRVFLTFILKRFTEPEPLTKIFEESL